MFTGLIQSTGKFFRSSSARVPSASRLPLPWERASATHRGQHRGERCVPDGTRHRARREAATFSRRPRGRDSGAHFALSTCARGHRESRVAHTGGSATRRPCSAGPRGRHRYPVEPEPVDKDADPALADWWLTVAIPDALAPYMVEKGSIAIEGISLTIARWERNTPARQPGHVAVIPHTYAGTNLHTLKLGQPVNVEADVFVKFMEQRSARSRRASM